MAPFAAHFRAHERRAVRLAVALLGPGAGVERPAVVTNLSLAGAGLETDEPLRPGERVGVTLSTPTMWDPLVIEAIVAWAHSPQPTADASAMGRVRTVARAGVTFVYPTPSAILAMFEMLATLAYE